MSAGKDEIDEALGGLWKKNGYGDLFKPEAASTNVREIPNGGSVSEEVHRKGVKKLTTYLNDPSVRFRQEFLKYAQYIQSTLGGLNFLEIIHGVMKDSIRETIEDRNYFAQKLQLYNEIGAQLTGYLSELDDSSRDQVIKAARAKYSEMGLTTQPVESSGSSAKRTHDRPQIPSADRKRLDRRGLESAQKELELMQETVRSKRQMASTSFQNSDQRVKQMYDLLSAVMKAMREMRMGSARNML